LGPEAVGIVPARYDSRRFPGKLLAKLDGKTLLEWVYRHTCRAETLERVLIATDSEEIAAAADRFGAEVFLSTGKHFCGLDRVAEAARGLSYRIVCDVQADQPFIPPGAIDECVRAVASDPGCSMATLATRVDSGVLFRDPGIVKVVVKQSGEALYFSRSPVPYMAEKGNSFLKHHGVYCLRKDFLLEFPRLGRGSLEVSEDLEQLRVLERGGSIKVVETQMDWEAVNTEADLSKLKGELSGQPRSR